MKKLCLLFCLLAFGCAHNLTGTGSQTGLDDFQDGDIVNATKLNAIKNTADAADSQATTNAAAILVLQAYDAALTALTDGGVMLGQGTAAPEAMAVLADGEVIVGDGTTDPVAESGATLRTSIGVGTGDSPQFTGIELSHATANTLSASSGDLSIEGSVLSKVVGDVYSGTHDFGGAVVEVQNGTNPTADDPGEIAHDTTANQIVLDDNIFHPEIFVPVAIENLAAGDDNYEFFIAPFNMTVTGIGVHCRGTCTTAADISLEDRAGNAMTHGSITPSTGTDTTTFYSITAANSLIKGEGLCFDVDNAVSPETDVYTFTVIGTVDRQ
jgi:hypothetical protein